MITAGCGSWCSHLGFYKVVVITAVVVATAAAAACFCLPSNVRQREREQSCKGAWHRTSYWRGKEKLK